MITLKEIETEIGVILGYNSIFIEKMEFYNNNLYFYGNFKGKSVTNNPERKLFIPYKIIFSNVISYFDCNMAIYKEIEQCNTKSCCSFGIIEGSEYLTKLPIREDYNKENFNQYLFRTYYRTFNIIATDYKLILL